jgi:hypothetical protein
MFKQMKKVRAEYLELQERERCLAQLVIDHPSLIEELQKQVQQESKPASPLEQAAQEFVQVGNLKLPSLDLQKIKPTSEKDDEQALHTPIDLFNVRKNLAEQLQRMSQ